MNEDPEPKPTWGALGPGLSELMQEWEELTNPQPKPVAPPPPPPAPPLPSWKFSETEKQTLRANGLTELAIKAIEGHNRLTENAITQIEAEKPQRELELLEERAMVAAEAEDRRLEKLSNMPASVGQEQTQAETPPPAAAPELPNEVDFENFVNGPCDADAVARRVAAYKDSVKSYYEKMAEYEAFFGIADLRETIREREQDANDYEDEEEDQ